jgi:ketopantoate reductase
MPSTSNGDRMKIAVMGTGGVGGYFGEVISVAAAQGVRLAARLHRG